MGYKFQFSVCMNVYHKDDPDNFQTAFTSIVNQTVKPDQIVLVVDGPIPEKLDAVIRGFASCEELQVIRLEENQGLGKARGIGLAACKYPLVAMMDADDISVSDRFERQLEVFAENPALSIVGGQITEFIDDPTNIVGCREVPITDAQIKKRIRGRNPMNHVTVMLKLQDVVQAGGYQDWLYHEDYFLWIRMAAAGMQFANVPQVLVNVRIGEQMYQRRGGWKYFMAGYRLQKYMLDNGMSNALIFSLNVVRRFLVQIAMPNSLRGWIYRKFARTHRGKK